jgi:hypothetical protein
MTMQPRLATQQLRGSGGRAIRAGVRVQILRDDGHGADLAGKEGLVLPLEGHNPPWKYVVLEVADEHGEPTVWYVHHRHLVVLPDAVVD